eukprot:jgi/Psemu1/45231/gm1.45231_g
MAVNSYTNLTKNMMKHGQYANFIKVLRQKYNQLGIEGVEGKITDVLTHDYGGDNSELVDVWSKNIEKCTTEDTEGKSATKLSTSYKTKLSTTNSAQKSKSKIPKLGVLVKGKPVDSFNNNEADAFKGHHARGVSYRNRANRFKDDYTRGDANRGRSEDYTREEIEGYYHLQLC